MMSGKPTMSKNMTEAHLGAVMKALPDEMEEGELCALILTIYNSYQPDPAEVISSLIASIYTYGDSQGISRKNISLGLRLTADMHDESKPSNQTAH
jgi:hypothetical protein